jgi:hypothetical protein
MSKSKTYLGMACLIDPYGRNLNMLGGIIQLINHGYTGSAGTNFLCLLPTYESLVFPAI